MPLAEWIALAVIMVAHFICALFTGFIIYTAQPGSSLFSWHPTFMCLAFGLLTAQAVLVFSPQSSIVAAYKTKVRLHWLLNSLATIFAVLGLAAIYINKEDRNKQHFTTWHGLLGIITIIYALLQSSGGLFQLYPGLLKNIIRLADLKLYHATSGTILYLLITISLVLGMQSNWFTKNVTGTAWYACAVCPIITLLIVCDQVTKKYVKKVSVVQERKDVTAQRKAKK